MKKIVFLIVSSVFILMLSCTDSTEVSKNEVLLTGTIFTVDAANQVVPLNGAMVSAADYFAQTISDSNGNYELSVELDPADEELSLDLTAGKAGYQTQNFSVFVKKGELVQAPDLTLLSLTADSSTSGTGGGTQTGEAAHIEISGEHLQHIYVSGSGLAETAKINFVVTDANGVAVDESHRVKVNFEILEGAGGGEYLAPDTMTTQNGMVFTVLSSGTKAGPVRIQASVEVNGKQVQTTPVRLAIYGGLPDPAHFSLAADVQNVAGLIYSGIIDRITAFVGDQYSNPVAPGTVVYFSSDYGITDGSAVTDEMGRATVQFMTADPRPPAPQDSSFAHITGWTFSNTQTEEVVTSRARVLLSGQTAPIQVSPASFNYNETNTPLSFDYSVSDIYGYPIVANSVIEVKATEGNLYGDTKITMKDTQASGAGITQFNFTWTPGDSLEAPQVMINIKVTTPAQGNGYRSRSILGSKE